MEEQTILEEDQLQLVTEEKLYDLNTIAFATFWGGPIAAGYLLYTNYTALGEEDGAKSTIKWAIFFTYLLFGGMFMLPQHITDGMPNYLVPLINSAIVYFIAKKLQGELLEYHGDHGGAFYSRWRAVWIGLVCVVITIVMLIPLLFFMP